MSSDCSMANPRARHFRSRTMRLRCAFCVFILFSFSTSVAGPQTKSPNAYRSAARGLSVGELFGVAESAGQGDAESQLLMGLSLQLVAERIEYDVEGRAGMLRLSARWFREAAERNFAPAQYFLVATDFSWRTAMKSRPCSTRPLPKNYLPAVTALGRRYMEGGRRGIACYARAPELGATLPRRTGRSMLRPYKELTLSMYPPAALF